MKSKLKIKTYTEVFGPPEYSGSGLRLTQRTTENHRGITLWNCVCSVVLCVSS